MKRNNQKPVKKIFLSLKLIKHLYKLFHPFHCKWENIFFSILLIHFEYKEIPIQLKYYTSIVSINTVIIRYWCCSRFSWTYSICFQISLLESRIIIQITILYFFLFPWTSWKCLLRFDERPNYFKTNALLLMFDFIIITLNYPS